MIAASDMKREKRRRSTNRRNGVGSFRNRILARRVLLSQRITNNSGVAVAIAKSFSQTNEQTDNRQSATLEFFGDPTKIPDSSFITRKRLRRQSHVEVRHTTGRDRTGTTRNDMAQQCSRPPPSCGACDGRKTSHLGSFSLGRVIGSLLLCV